MAGESEGEYERQERARVSMSVRRERGGGTRDRLGAVQTMGNGIVGRCPASVGGTTPIDPLSPSVSSPDRPATTRAAQPMPLRPFPLPTHGRGRASLPFPCHLPLLATGSQLVGTTLYTLFQQDRWPVLTGPPLSSVDTDVNEQCTPSGWMNLYTTSDCSSSCASKWRGVA
ncbi:hypothetical protein PYCCODRAFT_265636 [Trametes coccinea BRFM310]|uniref:Uncharacterized protein n=1 Tax=Trametes coccinea (strain BRFM310) TaxID=1353009 RepID=A0A1Y2IQE3_TRAC3|nr:hypothetical protein PYCCODRAFT_265636 [Trametes coccinea BRFM310]